MSEVDTPLVEPAIVERVLGAALGRGGEFAEIFIEDRRSTGISLDDRKVEELSSGRDRGAGIRVVVGETTGFAHTADLSEDGLRNAAEAAAAVARKGGTGVREIALEGRSVPSPSHVGVYPETISKNQKVELLRRADDAARAAGGAIVQVSAGYADQSPRRLRLHPAVPVPAVPDAVLRAERPLSPLAVLHPQPAHREPELAGPEVSRAALLQKGAVAALGFGERIDCHRGSI